MYSKHFRVFTHQSPQALMGCLALTMSSRSATGTVRITP